MGAPIRIMVTKIGLDGHDRGSRIIAAYLRDAGHEVIYTPPWQTIDAVVRLARQEDVAVIGVSSLATDHLIIPDLLSELRKEGLGHIAVIVGGIIPTASTPCSGMPAWPDLRSRILTGRDRGRCHETR
ncbi:cobalamin-dependent protein [Prescottella defluvii]|nr:cobalamin-dependent protein [Prescottella defluvii]